MSHPDSERGGTGGEQISDQLRQQTDVNYSALLALTRSLRAGLARRVVGWDASARSRLVAQGQTPAAI